MTKITATHENGSQITLTRKNSDAARTVELMKQSGYVKFEYPLPDPWPSHRDCDCMSCRPWTS